MITLHIKCHNNSEDSEKLREMGLDTPDTTEFRPFRLRPDLVDGFYADADGCSYVFFCGMEVTVKETFCELEKLIT